MVCRGLNGVVSPGSPSLRWDPNKPVNLRYHSKSAHHYETSDGTNPRLGGCNRSSGAQALIPNAPASAAHCSNSLLASEARTSAVARSASHAGRRPACASSRLRRLLELHVAGVDGQLLIESRSDHLAVADIVGPFGAAAERDVRITGKGRLHGRALISALFLVRPQPETLPPA
jgi:hypothetical protein